MLIGSSPEISRIRKILPEIAKWDDNLLITGEPGSGKSTLAKDIHERSERSNKPFISVNCTAVGDSIGETDLLGKIVESPSGIIRHVGLLDKAVGGTLFLDNIQDLHQKFQVRFTNIFRDKRFRRIGETDFVFCNFRIIGASSDLHLEKRSDFRKDLLLLINKFIVHIPPLRNRRQDIPPIFSHLLTAICREHHIEVPPVPGELFESLMEYDWPGNTSELKTAVKNLILLSSPGTLNVQYLPFEMRKHPFDDLVDLELPEAVQRIEKYLISRALKRYAGNQSRAAESLSISEAALRYKMKKYGMIREAF